MSLRLASLPRDPGDPFGRYDEAIAVDAQVLACKRFVFMTSLKA
jgi:hypothetical protein